MEEPSLARDEVVARDRILVPAVLLAEDLVLAADFLVGIRFSFSKMAVSRDESDDGLVDMDRLFLGRDKLVFEL